MRIFASDRVGLMQKLGMGEGEAIEHPWVTRPSKMPSVRWKGVT